MNSDTLDNWKNQLEMALYMSHRFNGTVHLAWSPTDNTVKFPYTPINVIQQLNIVYEPTIDEWRGVAYNLLTTVPRSRQEATKDIHTIMEQNAVRISHGLIQQGIYQAIQDYLKKPYIINTSDQLMVKILDHSANHYELDNQNNNVTMSFVFYFNQLENPAIGGYLDDMEADNLITKPNKERLHKLIEASCDDKLFYDTYGNQLLLAGLSDDKDEVTGKRKLNLYLMVNWASMTDQDQWETDYNSYYYFGTVLSQDTGPYDNLTLNLTNPDNLSIILIAGEDNS